MTADELKDAVIAILDDMKARDIQVMDVRGVSGVTDYMVICSGTSSRHVKSVAGKVELDMKQRGVRALGVEGAQEAEWVLVDFGDVVVHVMQPESRQFYDLEKLWRVSAPPHS